jgi:hypothetical protein
MGYRGRSIGAAVRGGRAGYPLWGTDKPFGRRTPWAGQSQRRDPTRRPRERTMQMLATTTVLAIAGTGYGLIGLLVIILLVVLILRLV